MRSLGAVLQMAARVIVVLSLIFGFEVVFPDGSRDARIANAATVGTGICAQTVQSSSSVTVNQSGNTCIVRFNASNTWTAPTGISSMDVLVVGGGGGGGGGSQAFGDGARGGGGGGGGGATNYKSSASFTGGASFTVTVGAGGAGGAANNTNGGYGAAGSAGGTSSLSASGFTTVTAAGGGAGTGQTGTTNIDAGGDGGASSSTVNGTTTSRTSGSNDWEGAGGGAGAGANGANGVDIGGRGGSGGNGGIGYTNSITGSSVAYSGGGGGGGTAGDSLNGTAGTGGSGGGGNGGIYASAPTAGTANIGGGGGGGGGYRDATYVATSGASGGSGTVIISYTETAPTLSSGSVNTTGTTLTLTFSEPMSSSTPAPAAFLVRNAGVRNPVTTVTASGSTLVLALREPVYSGQAVTVAYTDPTAGDDAAAAQDAAGFDLATFAATSVTSNATDALPSAARQLSLGTQTLVNLSGAGGNIRGITSDGSKVYMWRSADYTKMWEVPLSSIVANPGGSRTVTPTSWTITNAPGGTDRSQLAYSSGCIFVIDSSAVLKCIDLATRTASTVTVPASYPLPTGQSWMTGNLVSFPDGRIGKLQQPIGSSSMLRIYSVSGTGSAATLSWDEDMVLEDVSAAWPSDDHGAATDGTYLYRANYGTGGYRVWRLRSTGGNPAITFNGDGSGACGGSGTLCNINPSVGGVAILGNATFMGRDHLWGRYLMGDFDNPRFYMTASTSTPLTVTYDSQGGSSVASGTTVTGASIESSPGSPTKSNYTFTGWYTAASGGSPITFPYAHGQSSNFTLYAQWTPNVYTVTYDAQGGNSVTPGSWTYGTSLTLPTPTRAGYSFNGWSTTAQGSTLVYQTTQPYRSSNGAGNNIVYSAGYGKGASDVAATLTNNGTTFNRVRYRMEANYSGTLRYADVSFDKWSGATITDLAVPDLNDSRVVKQNVTNLTVDSNWGAVAGVATAVTNGTGKSGRVELWPWDYTQGTTGISPAGNGWIYDYDDTPTGNANYGSFQVHNLTDTQTVLAWNRHFDTSPDIGLGSFIGTSSLDGSSHPDWTFVRKTNFDLTTWKLQIFIGDLLTGGSSYSPPNTGDFTLYAQWTANPLTVTYDSQGGTAVSSGSTVTGGSIASSPGTPTRTGYSFAGWFAAASGGSAITFPYTHGQTANFTVYAQWTGNTNTITYDSQGGSAVSSSSWVTGTSLTVPAAPTRAGYTFNGWYTAASGGTRAGGGGDSYSPANTAGFTLYAQWSGNQYVYDANTGTGSTASQTYAGSVLSARSNGFTPPAGYSFSGWCTTQPAVGSACGGTPYAAAASLPTPASATVTLYAVWSANSYTVTYDGNGATGGSVPSAQVQNYNSTVTVQANTGNLVRSGYTFTGWNRAADGSGTNFSTFASGLDYVTYACGSGAQPARPCNASVLSSGTVSAIWNNWGSGPVLNSARSDYVEVKYTGFVMSPSTVTVTFQVDGDDGQYLTFNGTDIITNCWRDKGSGACQSGSVTLTGGVYYPITFWFYENGGGATAYLSWNTGAGHVQVPTANLFRTAQTGSFTLLGDTTLYAQWAGNSNTVAYNTQGGSSVSSVTWVTGTSLTLPAAPTRAGYTFNGWYDASSGGTKVGNASAAYSPANTAGFTLWAQWTANTLAVTYDSQNGSAIAAGSTVTGGSIASSPGSPSRAGHTFKGWFAASSGGTAITFPYSHSQTANFTLYAQWLIHQTGFAVTGAPASLTYGGTVTLGTTGGNGAGAVVYASTTPGVCTVNASSGVVSMGSGTGTCSIAVTKAGDATYDATSASADISAAKANQSALSVTGTASGAYGSTIALSTTGGSSGGAVSWSEGASSACTVNASGSVSVSAGTGSCSVTASMAGNSDYVAVDSASFTITVSRAAQTALSVTSTSVTYGQMLALATSGGSGTGAVTWEVISGTCSIDGSTLSTGDAGSLCQVRATKAQDGNWQQVQSSNTTVNVARATQAVLTVTSTSVTYDQTLALTTSGGTGTGAVTWVVVPSTGSTCTIAGTTLTPGDAGSMCVVRATKAQDTNYLVRQTTNTTITVDKAAQTGFSISSASSFTTGSPLALTATGGQSTGSVTWSLQSGTCTLSGATLTASRGGITCSVQAVRAGDTNWLPVNETQTVTVDKVVQTLTFRSTPPSPANPGGTYTVAVDSSAFLAPTIAIANQSQSVCSVSAGVVTFNSAGTCLVSASQAGNDTYSSAAASQSVTVTAVAAAAPVTVAPSVSTPVAPSSSVAEAPSVVTTTTTTTVPARSDAGAPTTVPATTTTTSTTTTTTVPADPSVPQNGADGLPPELEAGETTAIVRGQSVKVTVQKLDEAIVLSLPNDVKVTIGRTGPGGDSVAVAADGVLRMYRDDLVDIALDGLVPGTTYTIFMFSDPVELARGEAGAGGNVATSIRVPKDAAHGGHTVQVNGVGPGGEMVSVSMGFEVLERTDNTRVVVLAFTVAILLALLGGRPIFTRKRRRAE